MPNQPKKLPRPKQNRWTVYRHGWPAGPWDHEPEDRIEWRDAGTGLPCLMVRNNDGAWCGYVGAPKDHPSHQVNDLHFELEITYGGACSWPVCHTPSPGERDDIVWVGFDCCHSSDIVPDRRWNEHNAVYRTRDWVHDKVTMLANVIANAQPDSDRGSSLTERVERSRLNRNKRSRDARAKKTDEGICINGRSHGKATHGVLCRKCRAHHRGVPISKVEITASDDPFDPEERKILDFMFANMNMSPREVARHFGVPKDRVHDILARDLREVVACG